MIFHQVTAQHPACVEHGPQWHLHVRGDALSEFDPRLPLWVHPPASWIYLMPDPNVGEMGEAAVENLAPRACVRWLSRSDRAPPHVPLEEAMLFDAFNHGRAFVDAHRWAGFANLSVMLERADGNPRPWGTHTIEGREQLVVAPLAAGWPAWHTLDVESGAPGALFFHAEEHWRAERGAGGRRAVKRPPWLWIEGALDAVPFEQTVLYTTAQESPVRDVVAKARTAGAPRGGFVDFIWLGVDGDLVCFGRDARAVDVDDGERAAVASFLLGMMPARVAWTRLLREQLEALTLQQRRAWRDEANAREPGPFATSSSSSSTEKP